MRVILNTGLVRQGYIWVVLVALAPMAPAWAASDSTAADLLSTGFTPVGAERAGNVAGTIPAWTGGAPKTPIAAGARRPDLFGWEAKIATITAQNANQYAANLPAGARALFKKYPDYTMDIYPSHRTASLPPEIYAAIAQNATHAHASPDGIGAGVAGAIGGIPFPIPTDGTQAVWNHLLAFWGAAREVTVSTYVAPGDGSVERTAEYRETTDFPYYYPGATAASMGAYYFKTRREQLAPPARLGEAYIAWQPINTARDHYVAWRYLPGEHRMRKAPSLAYDTPDPDASGFQALDEYYLFFGGPDRYVFKLLGKREMYVPYNENGAYLQSAAALTGPHHANQSHLRYERHRVWVVEGTLAPGQHHVAPRRRLYLDEDTWLAMYTEEWDEDGRLWKFGHAVPYVMADVPAVIIGAQFVYDLVLGGYAYDFAFNDSAAPYRVTAPHTAEMFSPTALAADSTR